MFELSVCQHSGRWALILARRAPIFPRKISKNNMKNIRCHVKHANLTETFSEIYKNTFRKQSLFQRLTLESSF